MNILNGRKTGKRAALEAATLLVQATPTPNRASRRSAVKGLPKGGDELTGWAEIDLLSVASVSPPPKGLVRAWRSAQLSVQQYDCVDEPERVLCRLSVRRHDGARLREHWKTLWRIKEQIFPDCEAVEIYPTASDLVDDAPMWHLWVFHPEYAFGFTLGGTP